MCEKRPGRFPTVRPCRSRHLLEECEAQVLHIYFGHIAVHLLPLIRALATPTVVSFHGADVMVELDKPRYRAATREMLAAARLVLVRSESLACAVRDLGCPNEKIRLQRTGIPLDDIPFCERPWPDDGAWKFLQAGRLIEKKGFMTSLRAFAEFQKKNPSAIFTIAGEGPMRKRLEELRANLACRSASASPVSFLRRNCARNFTSRTFSSTRVSSAQTEIRKACRTAMLEAMASGLPVFATKHGGIPEAIDDGVSGVLVDERDDAALSEALLGWSKRPDALHRLAEAGARAVAANFEQKQQARALEDLYFEAIGG